MYMYYKAGMLALGLCPWVHDCSDPYHSIRIRIRIRMYKAAIENYI